jgi:Cyclin
LAIKYNEDDYFSNEFYSKVGGISLQEINALEYESLILIKHTLFVEQEFFLKYKLYLDQYLK